MRGSTAGLADTLAGGGRTRAAALAAADATFASLVVAPAVVSYWKSTWTLMDLLVLPDRPVADAAVCAGVGLAVNLLACLMQARIATAVAALPKPCYWIVSRLYTCIAGVCCVATWRGVWNLLNESTGDDARTVLATTAAALLALAALRALRNVVAAPFAVAIDSPDDYFEVPTMFRTAPVTGEVHTLKFLQILSPKTKLSYTIDPRYVIAVQKKFKLILTTFLHKYFFIIKIKLCDSILFIRYITGLEYSFIKDSNKKLPSAFS